MSSAEDLMKQAQKLYKKRDWHIARADTTGRHKRAEEYHNKAEELERQARGRGYK